MRGAANLVALLCAVLGCIGTCLADDAISLRQAVDLALARDALVRDAQQSLENAQSALVQARAKTPRLQLSSNTSAASSAGLDPESAVTGTEHSSSVEAPLRERVCAESRGAPPGRQCRLATGCRVPGWSHTHMSPGASNHQFAARQVFCTPVSSHVDASLGPCGR